jgi:hypothetical protein
MGEELSGIRTIIRSILRDEFSSVDVDMDWSDEELDTCILQCLRGISRRSPNKVIEVKTTLANSKILDISDIDDLLYIDKLEYPVGSDPRDFCNAIEINRETIEIDTSTTPGAGGSGTLTGTVTFATGSASVTGAGTNFTGVLKANYHIKPSGGTRWYRIYSIEGDTALTLAEPCRSTDAGADTINLTQYCYEAVYLYCAKLHILTETESTLRPQEEEVLIYGSTGQAALSKVRSYINKVPTGGATTVKHLNDWGITQLTLYQNKLNEISLPRTKRRYSKD